MERIAKSHTTVEVELPEALCRAIEQDGHDPTEFVKELTRKLARDTGFVPAPKSLGRVNTTVSRRSARPGLSTVGRLPKSRSSVAALIPALGNG